MDVIKVHLQSYGRDEFLCFLSFFLFFSPLFLRLRDRNEHGWIIGMLMSDDRMIVVEDDIIVINKYEMLTICRQEIVLE
jgi:hypothetical protein